MGLARGIDVSTWQHPGGKPIDWWVVAEAGYTFVAIKATQGTGYVNPWFERDYEDAFAAGLLVGAYHYFVAGEDPAAQAQHFVGTLIGKRLEAHAWLDFEVAPVTNWTAAGWANGFLEACKDGRPGVGLYCDQSWWDELRGANVTPPALWLAGPSLTEPPPGATLWQCAPSDVPGVPAPVDVDYLVSTRGLNLPSAPAPKPSPTVVRVPEPDPEDDAEVSPEDDADGGPDAEGSPMVVGGAQEQS